MLEEVKIGKTGGKLGAGQEVSREVTQQTERWDGLGWRQSLGAVVELQSPVSVWIRAGHMGKLSSGGN